MSIQDSLFDIDAALEGKPERELFAEVMNHYFGIENERDHFARLIKAVANGEYARKCIIVEGENMS